MHYNNLRQFVRLILEGGGIPRNMSLASMHSAKYRNNKNYPFHKNYKTDIKEESAIEDLTEISPEEIVIPKEFIHEELNTSIWNNEDKTLKPEIRAKLLKISKEFYDFLNITIKPKYIRIVGSMANYNWTKHSDIDLHLYFDFNELSPDKELATEFFRTKKSLWNIKHEILIKNFDVELYCNDLEDSMHSSGIYNLADGKWFSEPNRENFHVDKKAIQSKTASLIDEIENIENNTQLNHSEKYDVAILFAEKLKNFRQAGLDEGGEFSIENLTFKYLRNNGYVERLFDIIQQTFDKNLSIT